MSRALGRIAQLIGVSVICAMSWDVPQLVCGDRANDTGHPLKPSMSLSRLVFEISSPGITRLHNNEELFAILHELGGVGLAKEIG